MIVVEPAGLTSGIIDTVSAAEEEAYSQRLADEAQRLERGIYPRTVFIGLGGTGAKALMHLRRLIGGVRRWILLGILPLRWIALLRRILRILRLLARWNLTHADSE
jgi:hypothetical protein